MKILSRLVVAALMLQVVLFKSPANVFAGEEDMFFMEIPSVVGVSMKEEKIKDAPMSVYVATREELKRWGIHRITDLYGRITGVAVLGQKNPFIRGINSPWGTGVGLELAPVPDWLRINFPVNFFKSVEVGRGPAGLTWGTGAQAGMINMNFRDDVEGGEISYEVGNSGQLYRDILFGKKFADGDAGDGLFVGYHEKQKDSELHENPRGRDGFYRTEGGPLTPAFVAKTKYKGSKFLFYKDQGIDYSELGPDAQERSFGMKERLDEMNLTVYLAEYKLPLEFIDITFNRSYYEKKYHRSVYVTQSFVHSENNGFRASKKLINDKLSLNIGGTLYRVDTDNDPTYRPASTASGNTAYSLMTLVETRRWDYYLEGTYKINDKWSALLGARVDYQENHTSQNIKEVLFGGPRVAVFYDYGDGIGFKYIFNNSLRRPAGNEATYSEVDITSAETLISHDLNVNVTRDKVILDATVYNQYFTNTFYRTIRSNNYSPIGLELAAKYRVLDKTLLYWNGAYSAVFMAGTPSNLYCPRHTSFVGVEHLFPYFSVNADVRNSIGIEYYDANRVIQSVSSTFFDLGLRTSDALCKSFSIGVIVNNVLDNVAKTPPLNSGGLNSTGTDFLADPTAHSTAENRFDVGEGRRVSVSLAYKW